jgi:hypothetical protein
MKTVVSLVKSIRKFYGQEQTKLRRTLHSKNHRALFAKLEASHLETSKDGIVVNEEKFTWEEFENSRYMLF